MLCLRLSCLQDLRILLALLCNVGTSPGEELLRQLSGVTMKQMHTFTSQNISNAVMSFAKLEFHPGTEGMQLISESVVAKIETFTAQVQQISEAHHSRPSLTHPLASSKPESFAT